jgi:hypothetical protein
MFRTVTATEPAPIVVPPAELIPLSVLGLNVSAPVGGWEPFLTVRNLEILVDDIGRPSVSRDDARTLIAEKHENERRAQEVAKRNEQRMIESDRVRRESIWGGLPWYELPDGVLPVVAMTAADKAAQPKRMSPLQEALSGESMTYHPIAPNGDES